MYIICPDLRGYAFKLILVLASLDVSNSIGFLIPTYDSHSDSISCYIQAVLLNTSSLAGILWTSIIAYSLYSMFRNEDSKIQDKFNQQLLLVVLICTIAGVIPAATATYGRTSGWCWIKHEYRHYNAGFFERAMMLFVPYCLALIANTFMYSRLLKTFKTLPEEYFSRSTKKALGNKLVMYPLILFVCYLPYTAKQVIEETRADKAEYLYTFTLVSGVMRCMHGFCNSIVYGFTEKVRERLKEFCFHNRAESAISMLNKSHDPSRKKTRS